MTTYTSQKITNGLSDIITKTIGPAVLAFTMTACSEPSDALDNSHPSMIESADAVIVPETPVAIKTNPYKDRLCDPEFNTGSLKGNWEKSFTHMVFVEDDTRAGRGLAYGRFADAFWGNMDSLQAESPAGTVRDSVGMIEASYKVAMKAHGAEIKRLGVDPYLRFERGIGVDSPSVQFDLNDLKDTSALENPTVLKIFAPGEDLETERYDRSGLQISIRLDGSRINAGWGALEVGDEMARYQNVDLDGPVSQLFGNTEAFSAFEPSFTFSDDSFYFETHAELIAKYPDWAEKTPKWTKFSPAEYQERRHDTTFVSLAQLGCPEPSVE